MANFAFLAILAAAACPAISTSQRVGHAGRDGAVAVAAVIEPSSKLMNAHMSRGRYFGPFVLQAIDCALPPPPRGARLAARGLDELREGVGVNPAGSAASRGARAGGALALEVVPVERP